MGQLASLHPGVAELEAQIAGREKEPKNIARGMWNMTGEINQRVKSIAEPDAQVRCITCHQGKVEPPV